MNDLILCNTLILSAIFLHSLSHCTSHERLSSRWILKYFIEFHLFYRNIIGGYIHMILYLCVFPDQHHGRFICIYSKTITGIPRNIRIKWVVTSCSLDTREYMIISSAKVLQFLFWTCCGKSFTYSRNNNGSRIEPCGTPMVNGRDSDITLFTRTHWRRTYK